MTVAADIRTASLEALLHGAGEAAPNERILTLTAQHIDAGAPVAQGDFVVFASDSQQTLAEAWKCVIALSATLSSTL